MKMKEGIGWKACYNDEKGVYGAEVMFQGSWLQTRTLLQKLSNF